MPTEEAMLKCLEMEWKDLFHTRTQTWHLLQIEALVAVALVGLDWRLDNVLATVVFAIILIALALFGAMLTLHHRNNVEVYKIQHIYDIEEKIGMLEIFNDVKKMQPVKWTDAFRLKSNTSLYMLRIHAMLVILGVMYLTFRLLD